MGRNEKRPETPGGGGERSKGNADTLLDVSQKVLIGTREESKGKGTRGGEEDLVGTSGSLTLGRMIKGLERGG